MSEFYEIEVDEIDVYKNTGSPKGAYAYTQSNVDWFEAFLSTFGAKEGVGVESEYKDNDDLQKFWMEPTGVRLHE